jgi:hypothetical protein
LGAAVVVAVRNSIRMLASLRRKYGKGRWRKLKAIGDIRLRDGTTHRAELHWYEAHGVGRRDMKIKRLL